MFFRPQRAPLSLHSTSLNMCWGHYISWICLRRFKPSTRIFLPPKQLRFLDVNLPSAYSRGSACVWCTQCDGRSQSYGTFPPPGWCFMLSVEPILDLTFFRSGIGAAAARGAGGRLFSEPGDLGVERTTATFFTLLASAAAFAWLEGDFGVPGLLCPLWAS